MVKNTWWVPVTSFVLAVLLAVVSGPKNKMLVRAAEEATGTTTKPCSVWELKKIRTKVDQWTIRVTDLDTEMRNEERVHGFESTWTVVKAEVRGHRKGAAWDTFQELPGTYVVVIENEFRQRGPKTHKIDLAVQRLQVDQLKKQIEMIFRSRQPDLLGNPLPPADVEVDSITLLDQTLRINTDGSVLCVKSNLPGVFIPRPLDVVVTGGSGVAVR